MYVIQLLGYFIRLNERIGRTMFVAEVNKAALVAVLMQAFAWHPARCRYWVLCDNPAGSKSFSVPWKV
jgi:hypothetical protein